MIQIGSTQNAAEIAATGLVTTENEADYSFKISGIIQNIYVEEGQFFKKGKLLATLNSTEIGAGVDQANLNVEKAKRDYTRTLNLYRDSVNTLEQMQDAKTKLDLAQKSRQVVAFNAQYSKIYAVTDGFVNKKIANIGEVISAGSPVLSINESRGNGDYILKVGVTDKEWVMIELGQSAKVTLDGYPEETIQAAVFRKSQVSNDMDGSYQIELKLKLNKSKPAIGMFGKAVILTQHNTSSKMIPYDALIEADGNKAFVFTITSEGKVKKVPIIIDDFDNQQVAVKSGLENTKQIIVSNSAFLNEQSQIKVIK
ncbi:efflux RND transporter periplasmic adaptor subunit [Flavobacterium sp. LC2016-01]|uniref:efflux RND transporter periplasmic adaptor subunit n=1 Tax=Flavobacterium sp. LC2016-01 TaxID=2675876 RepID=UPI0032219D4C